MLKSDDAIGMPGSFWAALGTITSAAASWVVMMWRESSKRRAEDSSANTARLKIRFDADEAREKLKNEAVEQERKDIREASAKMWKTAQEFYQDQLNFLQAQLKDARIEIAASNSDRDANRLEAEFQWRCQHAYKNALNQAGIPIPPVE